MEGCLQLGFVCIHRYSEERDIISRKGETNKYKEEREKNNKGREKTQAESKARKAKTKTQSWKIENRE
jgi:hypothetical protein